MISINKYGQTLDLSKIVEVNGKKTFSLDGLVVDKSLLIEVPKDTKFSTSLEENDLKIEFKEADGNVFELILKNMANLLAQNDGTQLVKIMQFDDNKVLASIVDITSALEAAAAGPAAGANNGTSDSAANPALINDGLDLQNTTYDNARVANDNLETNLIETALIRVNIAPTIEVNLTSTVDEDGTTTITFVASDINISDILTSNVTALNGTVTILGNVITYVPNENFNGNDTITLTVNDGTVDVIKTIAVTVNPINDIPTISADSKTVVEDTAALLTTSGTITVVDVDNNESFVVAQINTSGLYGTFNIDENGEWTYLADNIQTVIQALSVTETLIETFIVTSKDGTTTNNVTVTIQGTNDIPTISNYIETINVEENVLTGSISLEDVNANDIDSTDELEFVALTNAAVTVVSSDTDIGAITVSMNSLGEYILSGAGIEKLAEGESATVTFQVQVKDDSVTDINISSASIITLTIAGSNDAPTVKVAPTLVLSEIDFAELFGTANAYKLVTEEEMYALLNVNDVDVNDKISISLVSDSSNFTSLNVGVNNDNSGVIKVTKQMVDDNDVPGAKEGDFLIFSAGFDGLGNSENATVTFDVVVTDGIVNTPSTLSVTVNGTNDAPTVKVAPTLVLSEIDFAELFGTANAYKLVTEEEMYALLNVNDVDVNDKISISLVSDSSNFTSLNVGVNNDNSGVIKVTKQMVDDNDVPGAKEGDFLIFSAGFDGLGNSENATVTFDVVVTDGIVNTPSTLSVTVNGTNDAPTVKVAPTLVLSEDSFAELSGLANAYKLVTEEEMYALLNVNDVDVNDKISISLVSDSSNFTSLNAGVTNENSGVIKVTKQMVDDNDVPGAKEGDFLIFSAGFDGLGNSENATVTFDVVVTDGIVNTPSTLSVTVNGTNDAPTVKVAPTLVLSEDSFAELSGLANAYKLVTEEEMYALLNVNDVDVNDKISISLVSDSSNFTSLNAGVTNENSGVIKVTKQMVDDNDVPGAKEGDFLIFSAGFDGLGNSENATVTFDVVVTDGIVNTPSTLSVTVNGTNDAPTVKVAPTLVLSEDSFAELSGLANAYKLVTEEEMYALLNVNDVDVNDKISISLVSDSSNFTSLNAGVTNENSGVIKVTKQMVDDNDVPGAKEGDFLIFSAGFDGLGNSENATVTFDVVVTDGIVNTPSTLSVTVNGTNDAPTVKVAPTLVLSEDSFAELSGLANAYKLVTEEEMYALLNVNDVDVNDKISISLVSDSSNFTSLNAGVTNENSGVIKVTKQMVDDNDVPGAKEGDFLIFSAGFDGLGNSENATVTFDVVVTDGIVNTPSTLSVTVNGTNDAPTVKVAPTLVLSEDSFAELSGLANAYKLVTEEEMYALLNVNDVDVNDKISISLVSDSSNFTSLNAGVTNENSGVIKVTKQMVDDNDVPGAKEGDFLIFSAGFDGLGNSENATVTFDVVVTDGIVNTPSTLSVTVNGTNDAPTVKVAPTLVLSEDSFAELSGLANAYKLVTEEEMYALLNVNDVDVNDKISISLVSDSSNFTSLNAGVTNENSGVIKVTKQMVDDNDVPGAKEGDFLIFSAGFDGLGNSENATVTFDVVVTDGIVNTPSTLSVTVNGTNDAPTVKATTEVDGTYVNTAIPTTYDSSIIVANINATDTDINDTLVYSIVVNSLDDSQYLSIDSITGVVTFIDETAYNTANISALNFQVKVLDLNAAEAVYSIQSGTGIDGYIVNMTVFSDFDNDQTLDSTEASDQTNSQGEFTLSGTDLSGTIVGYGGTDISTGLNFEGLYKAPAGSIVLNPITTLLVNLMNEGNTLEEAKTIIKDDFGITASVDLQADPIGQALSSTATPEQQTDYIALQMLSTKIDNTVGQIASAINGANITDERNAFDVVSQELAKLLNSGSVDLDNATFIDTLITNSLIALNGSLNTNIQSDLVDVILNINTSVSQAITTSTTPLESLESLAKVQIAAEEIENAFEAGVIVEDTSAVVISSLSENFTVKVDAAEVGLISKEQISNNAPVASISSTISSNENVTYVGQLVASDEDVNDTLTYSYDNSSVSMTLSVTGLNNLDSLVALNNPLAIQALTELKTVGLTFVNTGNVLALTTLSSSTIVAAKIAVSTLQDFLDSNSGLKNDIVALKDFISANKASIIAHTALVAQDIVLLETLLTPSNITALGNLFNTLETFVSDPVAQAIVKNILADNVVSPTELALLAPIAPQIQLLRTEIVTLLASNPAIIGLLDIPTIISKLQEVVDVDTVKGEITATVEVPSTIAEMMISLDENTGEYTVTNPYLAALPESTQVEVNFDYTVTDSLGDTDSSTASMLITTANVNEMNVSINDNNVLMIDESQNIDMASLLSNATSNLNVADIDSIDLSNSEHILSNITIADFEEMVSDDSSNTLSITGENDDIVKLDLSIWTKNEADTDINSVVDNMDDNFIAYTTTGTHNQVLTLLIDKDIIVQDI